MTVLTKKQLRTVDYAVKQLFGKKSFMAPVFDKSQSGLDFLSRKVNLTDHRTVLLTDSGLAHMRNIVAKIDEADVFSGLANYSDIWSACHHTLGNLLSQERSPENGDELLALIRQALNVEITNHTFVVPLFGIEMDGIDFIPLGAMKIIRPSIAYLDSLNVKHDHADIKRVFDSADHCLWLTGSVNGTPNVALEKFRMHAELVAGMLSICAASMYEHGASRFRIGTIMSPEQAYGPAAWLSWDHESMAVVTHRKFVSFQNFSIDSDFAQQLTTSPVLKKAFHILESEIRTSLEDAITKGVYWFSDAQRDQVQAMKLIKYWSCVEAFFSTENKDITRAVSTGLAWILVFGGYGFVPENEYTSLKKRISELYKLRSRAVHRATHHHVAYRDTADLSKMVAQLLLNMISLAEQGHSEVKTIKETIDRLDAKMALSHQ